MIVALRDSAPQPALNPEASRWRSIASLLMAILVLVAINDVRMSNSTYGTKRGQSDFLNETDLHDIISSDLSSKVPSTIDPSVRSGTSVDHPKSNLPNATAIGTSSPESGEGFVMKDLNASSPVSDNSTFTVEVASLETLCEACKKSTVKRYFTCVARIKLLIDGSNLTVEAAQGHVSKQFDDCSACDPATCKHENQGVTPVPTVHEGATNTTILFVHIGKFGGDTVKNILDVVCESHRNDNESLEQCLQRIPKTRLNAAVQGYAHAFQWYSSPSIVEEARSYLFDLTHPLDRALSWYKYSYPGACDESANSSSTNCHIYREVESDPNGWAQHFFHQCFPSVHDWATKAIAASSPSEQKSSKESSDCPQLGLETFKGTLELSNENRAAAPMISNLQQNEKLTIGRYPGKETLVVRARNVWEDLKALDKWLGGSNEALDALEQSSSSIYEPYQLGMMLSRRLCCILTDEMLAYRDLVERAANIDQSKKEEELAYLAKRCGSPSWSQWLYMCGVSD